MAASPEQPQSGNPFGNPFEQDSIWRQFGTTGRYPWLEASVVCLISLSIGVAQQPLDPLFAKSGGFPWSVFAPVLMGLRYGFSQAFVAACALHVFALVYSLYEPAAPWPLPFAYSLGLLFVAMIAGEFRDAWQQRLQKLERSNEYRQARLEEFTRSYHVLKASHDQLEQQNAGNQRSLRSALLHTRELLVDRTRDDAEFASLLLEVLRTHCSLQAAAMYKMRGSQLADELAAVGKVQPLSPTDALLTRALVYRATASLDADDPEGLQAIGERDCVICVPLIDTYGRNHAVIAVFDIPFFAYTAENLQLMSIIAGQVADFQTAAGVLPAADLGLVARADEYQFALQALRCLDNAHRYQLPSSLLCVEFTDAATAPAFSRTIAGEVRGLDVALTIEQEDQHKLLILMPLTGRAGLDQFLVRFNSYFQRAHGTTVKDAGIEVVQHMLTTDTVTSDFNNILARYMSYETSWLAELSTPETLSQASG